LIFSLIIIFFLLTPFPIFVSFIYDDFNFYIILYKIKIDVKTLSKKLKGKANKNYNIKDILITLIEKREIFYSIKKINLKPLLYFKLNINLGFSDAQATGLISGALPSIYPLLISLLSLLFNIKKYNFKTTPDFNNPKLNINSKNIIILNIFIILYLAIKIYRLYSSYNRVIKKTVVQ